jgi:hypothetical protein
MGAVSGIRAEMRPSTALSPGEERRVNTLVRAQSRLSLIVMTERIRGVRLHRRPRYSNVGLSGTRLCNLFEVLMIERGSNAASLKDRSAWMSARGCCLSGGACC